MMTNIADVVLQIIPLYDAGTQNGAKKRRVCEVYMSELREYIHKWDVMGCVGFFLNLECINDKDIGLSVLEEFSEYQRISSRKFKVYLNVKKLFFLLSEDVLLVRKAGCQLIFVNQGLKEIQRPEIQITYKQILHNWHSVGVMCYFRINCNLKEKSDADNLIFELCNVMEVVPIDFFDISLSSKNSLVRFNRIYKRWLHHFYRPKKIILLYRRSMAVQISSMKVLRVILGTCVLSDEKTITKGRDYKLIRIADYLCCKRISIRGVGFVSWYLFYVFLQMLRLIVLKSRKNRYYMDDALLPVDKKNSSIN